MKAISLHQPWATFIALKWKTIETRTHEKFKGLIGQRIAIHAAKKIDLSDFFTGRLPCQLEPEDAETLTALIRSHRGRVICTALVKNATWAMNDFFVEYNGWNARAMTEVRGKFCLFLDEIELLKKKVYIQGRQGIFEVQDDLLVAGKSVS